MIAGMYVVVIVFLSLLLAFPGPLWPMVREARYVLAAVGLATILPALLAAWTGRRVLQRLDQRPDHPGLAQAILGRGTLAILLLMLVSHASVLLGTTWIDVSAAGLGISDWLILPGLIAMMPFLVSILLVWIALYPADRAIRQVALEVQLFRSRPVRPVWGLGEYLAFNLRHQVLFVLVPMLMLLTARDIIEYASPYLRRATGQPYIGDLLLGAAALVMAVITPAILRRVWCTRPLPDGPLRDRLVYLCKRLRLRVSEILVWRSGGMLVNAAVMGVVAPWRYVLITDAMLEQMDDTRVEAVFGHEAGHVTRHHITFLLLFAAVTGCAMAAVSIAARRLDPRDQFIVQGLAAAALFIKWGLVFGWISRRFESEADLAGVRTLTLAGVQCQIPCRLHQPDPETATAGRRQPLCASAAGIFGDTLNEVAVLNGIPPDARSFRHGSISARSRFVQLLAADPVALQQFERLIRRIKLGIAAAAVLSAAWAAWSMQLWRWAYWETLSRDSGV